MIGLIVYNSLMLIGKLERIIAIMICAVFLFLVLTVEFDQGIYYECANLSKYEHVPNDVVEQCIRLIKPTKVITT